MMIVTDTEWIPIRFTSDLGKLDYVKLYDIYDGPISYIDDPRTTSTLVKGVA